MAYSCCNPYGKSCCNPYGERCCNPYGERCCNCKLTASPYGHQLIHMADSMKQHIFSGGQVIINQGDVGDTMYVIEEGLCAVHVEDVGVVAKLKAGNHFGEVALIKNETRNATITVK